MIRRNISARSDGDTRPSEPIKRLAEAAADVFELVQLFRESQCSTLESYQLLSQVFDEQCEVDGGAETLVTVRPPSKTDCDNVINPADPDARYNKHRGTGYLVQIMETYEDPQRRHHKDEH